MDNIIPESAATKFTNLQLELLRLFSLNIPDEELIKIKDMIARYLLRNKIHAFSEQLKNSGLSKADLEKWLDEEN